MAADMFLKMDDIKGESSDDKHKGEIDVLSWSWGMSQSGTTHTGTGGGAGKVNVQDLSITKYVDKASTVLQMACADGTHFKTATLTVRKAGKTPVEYLKIKVEDIIISSWHSGGAGGEERLTENVVLNFGKVHTEYTPQKADGTGDASVKMAWNIAANVKI